MIDADGTKLAYNYNYTTSRNFVEDVEPDVLTDDNFVSDSVNSIVKIDDTDYSVGKLNAGNALTDLVQNNQAFTDITYTKDKK